MKFVVTKFFDKEQNYRSQDLNIKSASGKSIHHYIHDLKETPEEAVIGGKLICANELLEVVKLAYEAGKNGEPLDVEFKKGDSE